MQSRQSAFSTPVLLFPIMLSLFSFSAEALTTTLGLYRRRMLILTVAFHLLLLLLLLQFSAADNNSHFFYSRSDLAPPVLQVDVLRGGATPGYIFVAPHHIERSGAALGLGQSSINRNR